MIHVRCLRWSLVGVALGLAWTAWAQDAAPPGVAYHPDAGAGVPVWLTESLKGAGLPTVLGLLGWWARGAMVSGVPIVVQLHPEDRELVRRATRRLAAAVEDPVTNPGTRAPSRRDDSDSGPI